MNTFHALIILLTAALFPLSCCSAEQDSIEPESKTEWALLLTSELEAASSSVDFLFFLEDAAGEQYLYTRGNAGLDTPYKPASTSKWVTAAIILTLADNGLMALDDSPEDYFAKREWPTNENDPLRGITLAQLLSFTSGLDEEVPCLNNPEGDFFRCITAIAQRNGGISADPGEPGASFHYGSAHLQVAGAMAVRAGGYDNWTELFNAFRTKTGLFPNSDYRLPSAANPRLAGGMIWTARDYIDFIRAFKNGSFYKDKTLISQASGDRLDSAAIGYSPAWERLGEEWHYGYGMWIECPAPGWNPDEAVQVSSPGAYGAYPFWNKKYGYFGIVARQGRLGTFQEGYAVFDAVREAAEGWALSEP